MVSTFPQKPSQINAPDYWDQHKIPQDQNMDTPLLIHEEPQKSPADILKEKYPIKIIAGTAILVIMVLAIPVGVYLNQRPTNVFIEATATPSPTPSPTPTPSATN